MSREQISMREAVSLVALFAIGNSLVIGISKESRQDAWISMLLAFAAVLPAVFVYARLMRRYPGLGLFDICERAFGRALGKIAVLLFAWYALHLGALVLRNFSEFIQVTAFNQMPLTIPLLAFIFFVVWGVRAGTETLGRWAAVALPVLLAVAVLTVLLLLKDMHPEYLLPVGENLDKVPGDAFVNFSYPFAETVLFLAVLNTLKPGAKPGLAWLYGLAITGATLLFFMFFRNAMVLGFPLLGDSAFPSYMATSVIIAGGFISRIEGLVGANLLIAGFVKAGICLMAASKGAARLFNAGDYRPWVPAVGLLMVALASTIYKSTMEMFEFVKVYPYYAFPFQVLLPLLLLAAAEIRFRIAEKA